MTRTEAPKEIRVAILGFGGIARLHYTAYCHLQKEGLPLRVAAVCTKDVRAVYTPIRINFDADTEALDPSIPVFSDMEEMLAGADFDLVDICLPTFLHASSVIRMLRAGKHVLCEKPMALSAADCEEMLAAAREADRRLMIAHSSRFDTAYLFLRDEIRRNALGALHHLRMERLSEFPSWSPDFARLDKTGGCLLDMQIHDLDLALFLFGEPLRAAANIYGDVTHTQLVDTRLFYEGLTVSVRGMWDESRTEPFFKGYAAYFERGSLSCDGRTVRIRPHVGEVSEVTLTPDFNIREEIRALAETILTGSPAEGFIPPESSAENLRLVELLRKSAEMDGIPLPLKGE